MWTVQQWMDGGEELSEPIIFENMRVWSDALTNAVTIETDEGVDSKVVFKIHPTRISIVGDMVWVTGLRKPKGQSIEIIKVILKRGRSDES